MTTKTDEIGGDVLSLLEEQFCDALGALEALHQDIRRGAIDAVPDMKKCAESVRAATQSLIIERKRIEDYGQRHAPGRADALDLGEARAEIGRRLARLRDA